MGGAPAVEVRGPREGRAEAILTTEALDFIGRLQREFGPRRAELLSARAQRQVRLDAGEHLDFLSATKDVREREWRVAPAPDDLQDRRVEITGPTDRKMVINALNSGAKGFMADFEDSNSPTLANMVLGHANLIDAI
jgi:malate synthase